MASRLDRMGIYRSDSTADDTRYGTLYMVKQRHNNVNDYGAADVSDAAKLSNITNAAPGSTCLFSNGDLYRLELSGWAKFGGTAGNRSVTTSRSVFDTPNDFTDTDGGEMR